MHWSANRLPPKMDAVGIVNVAYAQGVVERKWGFLVEDTCIWHLATLQEFRQGSMLLRKGRCCIVAQQNSSCSQRTPACSSRLELELDNKREQAHTQAELLGDIGEVSRQAHVLRGNESTLQAALDPTYWRAAVMVMVELEIEETNELAACQE